MLYLTRQQVRAVDRIAIERFKIPGIVLMENAAGGAASIARRMLARAESRSALILCGGGNNGGDGLAIARHLHNAGIDVRILSGIDPGQYKGDALINWRIVQAMGLDCAPLEPAAIRAGEAGLIVDAIFGTGLSEPPRGSFREIAAAVERSGRPVLAIDLPSGLDCDSGEPLGVCIRADRTATFVARKVGFRKARSACFTGRVNVVSIGAPPEVVDLACSQCPA